MFDFTSEILSFFARAGGGGSSGGSSGGGGELIAMLGYFPSYYLGKLVKKLLPRGAELVVSCTSAIIMSCVLLGFAVVLHGGWLFMILIIIGIWSGWYAAFFGTWEKLKQRAQKTKKLVEIAESQDSAWQHDQLLEYAKATFNSYQQDWSSFNVAAMQRYTSRQQLLHSALMLRTLREMGRSNTMANIYIKEAMIVGMHDSTNNAEDWFQVAFEAQANDTLRDTRTDSVLFSDKGTFTEYWTFVRRDSTWLLDRIDQATANISSQNKQIETFAHSHSFHYSLDMGWLFLPNHGVLFRGGRFGKSDINNHVVGMYGEHLMQLYTYTPMDGYNILVGQINLPKSYGGILIRRKTGLFSQWKPPKPPKEYQQHTLEWPDFHTRYEVSATDADRLATFELLNPGFMAYLYDTDPGVSIEVADNVVYLYKFIGSAKTKDMPPNEYEVLFTILDKAHKELKL